MALSGLFQIYVPHLPAFGGGYLMKKIISHNISLSSKILQHKSEIYSFSTKPATEFPNHKQSEGKFFKFFSHLP
jgi:hypothetical protein